ncbi:MAG: hypothetical protein V1727_01160 [Candidatus Omnitrophota bacterium]
MSTIAKTLIVCLVLLCPANAIAGQKTFVYEYYHGNSLTELTEKQTVQVEDLASGQKQVRFQALASDYTHTEEYLLGPTGETEKWKVSRPDEGANYSGEKKDNQLLIDGLFKGKTVHATIKLDTLPFYFEPKFNLTTFVLSELEKTKFLILRGDALTTLLMQAKKQGEETLTIQGQEIAVIKVYYAATGLGEKYYKRLLYFRKSDGMLVKKEDPAGPGGTTILTSEQ